MLKAFERMKNSHWGLVIVGKAKGLRNSIREIDQKKVLLLGEVPDKDLSLLYNLAELFIFPSFYEGFGLPPLEAMHCGCPTIVSNRSSLPEICGPASCYINPDSPEEIASMIEKILTDETARNSYIEKGFKQIKLYDWEDSARK
ncbi:MAG: glycosyltransferase family 1 protein, partial [Chlamydiota bacterium]